VPVLSALFDLQEYVADVCEEVRTAHQLPGATVREALQTIATQLTAARTLANERLDAIEAHTHSSDGCSEGTTKRFNPSGNRAAGLRLLQSRANCDRLLPTARVAPACIVRADGAPTSL